MTWQRWLVSLLNAVVSGCITAAAAIQVFHGTWQQDVKMALIAGAASGAKWYLQHPPPGVEEVVTKTQSLATDLGDGKVAVSTVEKTTVTPTVKP